MDGRRTSPHTGRLTVLSHISEPELDMRRRAQVESGALGLIYGMIRKLINNRGIVSPMRSIAREMEESWPTESLSITRLSESGNPDAIPCYRLARSGGRTTKPRSRRVPARRVSGLRTRNRNDVRPQRQMGLAMLSLLTATALGCSSGPQTPVQRGRIVYMTNCVVCHIENTNFPGSQGPAIAVSSRVLIEARVLHLFLSTRL